MSTPAAPPLVAIVGRPNVGKSTLMNRILGRRVVIVEEKPGVTRDRKEVEADWSGHRFRLVDTGGWMARGDALDKKVSAQSEQAIDDADVVLFVVDASTGVTDEDAKVAQLLRSVSAPVLLIANKVDDQSHEAQVWELLSLGLSEQTQRGLVEVLARPQGLLFVTGPVGSGKTTTLYSALKHVVDTRGRLTSVVTIQGIPDGASNTFLVGEKHIRPTTHFGANEDRSIFSSGNKNNMRRFAGTGSDGNNRPLRPKDDTTGHANQSFGGPHNGALFVFGDGSVKLLALTVDITTLHRLASRLDGLVPENY